jgi:plasmid maintenance system antidote protein VapI
MIDNFCDSYKLLLGTITSTGDCLDKALAFAGFDRNDLASHLGVDKATISRWINDSSIKHQDVLCICEFLQNNLLRDYIIYTLTNTDKRA